MDLFSFSECSRGWFVRGGSRSICYGRYRARVSKESAGVLIRELLSLALAFHPLERGLKLALAHEMFG